MTNPGGRAGKHMSGQAGTSNGAAQGRRHSRLWATAAWHWASGVPGRLAVLRHRLVIAIAVAVLVLAAMSAAVLAGGGSALSTRDQEWQQDIAYLARELPLVHVDGLTTVSRAAWMTAAVRLEQQVPRLSDGQVIVGMARMVAMLHDDETQLVLPPSAIYPFAARWIGNGLYLIGVPVADRRLLGARLVAVDGDPMQKVVARLRSEIDYQDPGIAQGWEVDWDQLSPASPGYLNDADLLHWLGITRSTTTAEFAVRTTKSAPLTVRLTATQRMPPMSYVPSPLYLRNAAEPYWLTILGPQRVVYLKYNHCLPGDGFQQVAARALAVLRAHPAYRLVVDLRDNLGGLSQPFQALITSIWTDPAINRPGRIFGLINGFTASAAAVDSYDLRVATNAVIIGQQAADPIDEFGDSQPLRLPHYGVLLDVTTAVENFDWANIRYGIPDIMVAPTLHDWLTGQDPVLAKALGYARQSLANRRAPGP
jgi:hypothetical protein